MNIEEVEINDITKLANFILDSKSPLVVESQDFKNNRDLFFFCVEITTKMLSIKYGDNTTGKVNIEDLTVEEIGLVKQKLIKSSIDFNIDIIDIDFDKDYADIIYVIPKNDLNDNVDLDKYIMYIKKKNKQYTINFQIIYYN
tara:strand:+ start:1974 stop:2399 length:426 start_codon:yes stop_codon:yes gene_type:complete